MTAFPRPISRLVALRRSYSFRLALLILFVLIASMVVIRISLFYAAVDQAARDVRNTVDLEITELKSLRQSQGEAAMMSRINQALDHDVEKMLFFAYAGSDGTLRAGNLAEWPDVGSQKERWVHFALDDAEDEQGEATPVLAAIHRFDDGSRLLVGHNMRHAENLRRLILNVLADNLGISILLALLSSVAITYLINRRLERVNRACLHVMKGSLGERIRLSGGGDEFDRLAINFNAMLDWIGRLIDGIRQSSDNIAHDLRTPLNRHRIRLDNLAHSLPPEAAQEIKTALVEVDMLVETFDSILRISQAETSPNPENFTRFDFAEGVEDVLEFYSVLAQERRVTLHPDIAAHVMIHADRPLLMQAVANLIDNAIKYSPEGGRVSVSLEKTDKEVTLAVQDEGPGIPPEFHARVTERFFRMEKSRTTPGTGLGLSLVAAVVRLHQARMEFTNLEPGFSVTIRLPL